MCIYVRVCVFVRNIRLVLKLSSNDGSVLFQRFIGALVCSHGALIFQALRIPDYIYNTVRILA